MYKDITLLPLRFATQGCMKSNVSYKGCLNMEDKNVKVFSFFDKGNDWKVDLKSAHVKEALEFWHEALRMILVFKEEDEPTILLQKRSKHKTHNKQKFDLSFASHMYDYPTLRDVVINRLPKETGLSHNDLCNLVNAGRVLDVSMHNNGKSEHCDKEIIYTLWGAFDRNISDLEWDKKEVESLWKIKVSDFWKLLDGYTIELDGFDGQKDLKQSVCIEDFSVRWEKFYEKILIMSERYCEGKPISM